MSTGRFVVAFNRDRDFYQVPLALEEAGLLERLITDLYVPDALARSAIVRRTGLAHRRVDGLSSGKVAWSLPALWRQLVSLRLARDEARRIATFAALDRELSERSLRAARKTGADFFLYSGYALEAFRAADSARRRKALFVYHPPAALAAEILTADAQAHPEMAWSYRAHMEEMASNEAIRVESEVRAADELVCASAFTRRSIQRVLDDAKPIAVAPYGCTPLERPVLKASATGQPARVLFAGQGVQRKGIHHLLKVWKRRRAWDAELTIIASRLDPAAAELASRPGAAVRLLAPLPRTELEREFAAADVFVMPSLVEGFGLVYLEALAAGCYTIGTENTGLPDVQAPANCAAITPAGDLDALEATLDAAIARANQRGFSPEAIQTFARTRSWAAFRADIRAAIGAPNPIVARGAAAPAGFSA